MLPVIRLAWLCVLATAQATAKVQCDVSEDAIGNGIHEYFGVRSGDPDGEGSVTFFYTVH